MFRRYAVYSYKGVKGPTRITPALSKRDAIAVLNSLTHPENHMIQPYKEETNEKG